MNLIRRILLIVLLLALAVLVFQNQGAFGQMVEFSFLSWSFSLVLGFWILFAFIAGVALFALVDAWRGMLLRLEIGRKNREIRELQERLIEQSKTGSGAPSGRSSANRDSSGE
jgi:uncharacterized integral membrane protein